MSSPPAPTISSRDLVLLLTAPDSKWDRNSLIIYGNVATGALVSMLSKPRKKLNRLLTPEIGHWIINDLNAASGTLIVNQGTSPWIVSTPATQPPWPDNFSTSIVVTGGVGSFTLSSLHDYIAKSAIIKTSSAAGNRFVTVGGVQASTKTIAPSSGTFMDLLDREIAVPKSSAFSVSNGDLTGDVFFATFMRLN